MVATEPTRAWVRSTRMQAAAYRFLDRWHVAASPADAYDVLACPKEYPAWWGDVFLAAEGDSGAAAPGKSVTLLARGFLPYCIRFTLECVVAERPGLIHARLSGDFEGEGTWTLTPSETGGTDAVLDWRLRVNKRGVKELTPLLRPLFRANHTRNMRRGQAAIARLFAAQSAVGGLPAARPSALC